MFHNFIFLPLYNGLIGIMDIIPGIDVGMAVIIFTIIIRLILFPLSKSSVLTQVRMKEVEPEANRIRIEYAKDKQTQALKIMELYKEKKVKPFSGVLLLFIQLPILFALISVFYKIIPEIDPTYLYSFVHVPVIRPTLLGLDLTSKSLVLAIITAIIQFLQMHYSFASKQPIKSSTSVTNKDAMPDSAQMMQSMTAQMKYFLPFIAFASVYWIIPATYPKSAAIIAIYWSISSLFTLFQELYIRKKHIK